MRRHLFLTGASGFVGINLLGYVLTHTDWNVTCPVSMRHHGRQDGLSGLHAKYADRLSIRNVDLTMPFRDTLFTGELDLFGPVDYVWNVASESHVDRSITEPVPFVRNNVDLMLNVLEFARMPDLRLFLHMSTDEVYGPATDEGEGHPEWSAIKPSNPYSASKAAQESVAFSYWRGFGVPLVITNTMNLLGPWQDVEKFVPKTIKALLDGRIVTVHASPEGVPGSRCWIDVADFAVAWHALTLAYEDRRDALTFYPDQPDEHHRYNIAGPRASNLEIACMLARIMDVPYPLIELVDFHSSRPGHDMHYALDSTKFATEFNWRPRPLEVTLRDTVNWYLARPHLLEEV